MSTQTVQIPEDAVAIQTMEHQSSMETTYLLPDGTSMIYHFEHGGAVTQPWTQEWTETLSANEVNDILKKQDDEYNFKHGIEEEEPIMTRIWTYDPRILDYVSNDGWRFSADVFSESIDEVLKELHEFVGDKSEAPDEWLSQAEAQTWAWVDECIDLERDLDLVHGLSRIES